VADMCVSTPDAAKFHTMERVGQPCVVNGLSAGQPSPASHHSRPRQQRQNLPDYHPGGVLKVSSPFVAQP
jgi:hypothetical protein